MPKPDFERNTLAALRKGVPERPALFELFMNADYYQRLAGRKAADTSSLESLRLKVDAFAAGGYDYATTYASTFHFRQNARAHRDTVSLNDGASIIDWESFERYAWNDPSDFSTDDLAAIRAHLPEGMKLMVMGPGGVLENLIALTGYDTLCVMLYEEPELAAEITNRIGRALVAYYETAAQHDAVGFLCSNDDWGFNTQTFLSPADMRRYIFPWHKRIVEVAHKAGKPCILHSCGYFESVLDDIIEDMRYDGRHSYEDNILPVERAYERMAGRIAVLGGMDMHFMATATPDDIFTRATAMLDRASGRGGYLLGTGNSVPEYIPFDNYRALLRAAEGYGR